MRKGGKRGDDEGRSIVPDFDIVLWGYDRRQVERCLDDLSMRLEEALSQLDAVEVLQSQLCEAHVEIDQLRRNAEEHPSWVDRISKIMMTAEALRSRATQEAEAIRARAHTEGLQPVSSAEWETPQGARSNGNSLV
jgi:cell division septum initiation protein DivIVA